MRFNSYYCSSSPSSITAQHLSLLLLSKRIRIIRLKQIVQVFLTAVTRPLAVVGQVAADGIRTDNTGAHHRRRRRGWKHGGELCIKLFALANTLHRRRHRGRCYLRRCYCRRCRSHRGRGNWRRKHRPWTGTGRQHDWQRTAQTDATHRTLTARVCLWPLSWRHTRATLHALLLRGRV